ncbi:hypothetical protein D3C86_2000730 [compost metagenome]
MLRQEVFAINDFRIVCAHVLRICYVVAQFIKRLHDDAEGFSAVVAFEVFDVFQHKNGRTAGVDNPYYVKKQRALRIAGKTVGAAQRVLFRHARKGKRLARKARQ